MGGGTKPAAAKRLYHLSGSERRREHLGPSGIGRKWVGGDGINQHANHHERSKGFPLLFTLCKMQSAAVMVLS